VGIHLRIQAEEGLERIGGRVGSFYASLALSGSRGQKRVAVQSLGRRKELRERSALLSVANDESADEALREEAREAIRALDRAENLEDAEEK
jgi:hypothetical protein